MLFRAMIARALLVGVLAGLLLTAFQSIRVTPLIIAAEAYESGAAATEPHAGHDHAAPAAPAQGAASHDHSGHDHGDSDHDDHRHHHDPNAWAPENGAERTLFTAISNIFAAIAFSAILMGVMLVVSHRKAVTGVSRGVLWGLGGFAVFFLAPALGLPPEIPGVQASDLGARQQWWTLAVVATGLGLLVLGFAKGAIRWVGLPIIVLPHVLGAPQHDGPTFIHPDATVVASLTEIHQQFMLAAGATNLAFWLLLGALCGWSMQAIFRQLAATDSAPTANHG